MGEQNFREERIEKLLYELRHEIKRGVMENEIAEHMQFSFVIPLSRKIPDGNIACKFDMRPVPRYHMSPDDMQPRLRVVK